MDNVYTLGEVLSGLCGKHGESEVGPARRMEETLFRISELLDGMAENAQAT